MDKKTLGFAIMLFSLILMIGFQYVSWKYINQEIHWPWIWMLTATAGFVLAILGAKKSK